MSSTLRAVILAIAIVFAGALVGRGIVQFRLADRYVSVKGVAERDVAADVGIWPLRFVSTDDLLDRAREKIESDRKTGVVDMFAGPTLDQMGIFPCRVIAMPGGATAISFTFFQPPDMPDEIYARQYKSLLIEMDGLKKRFSSR